MCPGFDVDFAGDSCHMIFDYHNQRIKLRGVASDGLRFEHLDELHAAIADSSFAWTKVVVYAHPGADDVFRRGDMVHEATLEGFFANGDDAHLWSAFLNDERRIPIDGETLDEILAGARALEAKEPVLAEGYRCRTARSEDGTLLARFLKAAFPDYPTPIAPEHQAMLIESGSSHFEIVEDADGNTVSVISAEVDQGNGNAEVSDCATLPDHQGRGLMRFLIHRVEEQVARTRGIVDFYTLARAVNHGVNRSFARCGYHYTGRLINNCRMPTGWETMNAFCKRADVRGPIDNNVR